jgi:hypothetical protein
MRADEHEKTTPFSYSRLSDGTVTFVTSGMPFYSDLFPLLNRGNQTTWFPEGVHAGWLPYSALPAILPRRIRPRKKIKGM